MSKRICQLGIFILCIATIIQCNSATATTETTCLDTQKLCGNKFCYDPTTHFCSETGSVVTCINTCGNQCYDSTSHVCIYGTVCSIGQDVCEVRYDSSSGALIKPPPQLQCYDPRYTRCLNHTICYEKDRVCNGQCILRNSSYTNLVCADDKKTLCTVPNNYTNYKPNQIQVCNGSCYDTEIGSRHCVNGSVQCVSDCSNVCYDEDKTVCLDGLNCPIGSMLCGTGLTRRCYDPFVETCLNGTVCANNRVCGVQCIGNTYQACANDKHTLCNDTSYYPSNRPYQMHLCNGTCFDTSVQQCINGVVSCIDSICAGRCYSSAFHVCLNNKLCPIGNDLCEARYDSSSGALIKPPQLQCYDPRYTRCLNHTICYEKDRVCNGQCILRNSSYTNLVCANDKKTLCQVSQHYNNYKPNRIQLCNGSCYDTEIGPRHCVNGSVQCVSDCSNVCYDENQKVCLNGSVCFIGYMLCGSELTGQCYDPYRHTCLNGTLCANDRVCGAQCIGNYYQVCTNDKQTVCNVTKPYNNYKPNQIQLCLGVCYDSSLYQCSGDHVILCIQDPITQQCVSQNNSPSTSSDSSSPSPSAVTEADPDISTTVNESSASPSRHSSNSVTVTIESSTQSVPSRTSIVSLSTTSLPENVSVPPISSDTTVSPMYTSTFSTFVSTGTSFDDPVTSNEVSSSTKAFSLSSSLLPQRTNNPSTSSKATSSPMLSSSSPTPPSAVASTETPSSPLMQTSNNGMSTTQPSSRTLLSSTSSFSPGMSSSSKGTDKPSTSSDAMSSPTFPSPSSPLTVTETHPSASTIWDELFSSFLLHSSSKFSSTTKTSLQTFLPFTSTLPSPGSCCAANQCTDTTNCCAPRVESRCYHYNRTRDENQACKTIVIGKNSNNSFVVAIAINDNKVIVMNNNHVFLLLLSMTITFLLLLLIPICVIIGIYHKHIPINFRVWYRAMRNYTTESERKEWEQQ